ncbi:MAG: alpha/beta fold hydrolase [Anaerolineae bacterium]|nr:alpha/beta fold hydrolase [Anaerolineae bacterium]
MTPELRIYLGLVAGLTGFMQARVAWRGLWGLSLARHHRRLGYLVAVCLMALGVALAWGARVSWLDLAWIAALALLSAIVGLVLLSSLVNLDRHPPDARHPAPSEPYSSEPVRFRDRDVDTPALLLTPERPNGGAVCWVHGTRDDKAQYKWAIARALARRGLTVLTFDVPGHGEHPRPFSLPEALTAVPAALSYLAARPDVDPARIGLLGVSLGGALSVRALAERDATAPTVRAVCLLETPCAVHLGPLLYVREAIGTLTLQALQILRDCSAVNLMRRAFGQPRAHFPHSIGWVFDQLAPADHVGRLSGIPLLLVYGGRDGVAPRSHGERLLAHALEPKAWHCVRAGSHLTLIFLDECAEVVASWFGEALGA